VVADDVRLGYVSVKAAKELYRVVVDAVTFVVDEKGTRRLREGVSRRNRRGPSPNRRRHAANLDESVTRNPRAHWLGPPTGCIYARGTWCPRGRTVIPDYQTLMLPLLRLAQDGAEHRIGDTSQQLAKEFALSDEEMSELLPSGRQPTFYNRVHW